MQKPAQVVNRWKGVAACCLLGALVTLQVGCNMAGYAAHVVAGGERKVKVAAAYKNMANHSVAIVVAADPNTLFLFPRCDDAVRKAVASRMTADIPGVKVIDPAQIASYQRKNPYWNTLPYADLVKALGAQRVVVIDLVQYNTREQGNDYVWRGTIVANVGVLEAEAANPGEFVFGSTVQVQFPEDKPVGVLDADDATVELGMLALFSQRVSWLFHEHEEVRK
jgi:hypothetical protein